jgi:hypothetical protein
MLKPLALMGALFVLTGCDVPVENFAPAEGASAAKSDWDAKSCSIPWREQHEFSLRNNGYSPLYLKKFTKGYEDECAFLQRHYPGHKPPST